MPCFVSFLGSLHADMVRCRALYQCVIERPRVQYITIFGRQFGWAYYSTCLHPLGCAVPVWNLVNGVIVLRPHGSVGPMLIDEADNIDPGPAIALPRQTTAAKPLATPSCWYSRIDARVPCMLGVRCSAACSQQRWSSA